MSKRIFPILVLCLIFSCQQADKAPTMEKKIAAPKPAAYSLSGNPLYSAAPSEKLLEKFEMHQANYEKAPSADNLIWYGRFMAYQGRYEEAIALFTQGITQFPTDARFYRHRGHRYISIRKFEEAILDFEKAVTLIDGKENEVEPDGMPNAQNIPVSTLHGNIYYHLGLAYYLKHDFPNALAAYQKCLATSNNADNVVSATHWLYMILRRMNQTESAQKVLAKIETEMPVIENMAYHQANLLYKGTLQLEDLLQENEKDGPSNDALYYGIGNWYLYNGNQTKAKAIFENILSRESWSSFGYIAAEKDYLEMQ